MQLVFVRDEKFLDESLDLSSASRDSLELVIRAVPTAIIYISHYISSRSLTFRNNFSLSAGNARIIYIQVCANDSIYFNRYPAELFERRQTLGKRTLCVNIYISHFVNSLRNTNAIGKVNHYVSL